jgi:hypothetical protein
VTDQRPDVRLVGPDERVLTVEETLGEPLIARLARTARQHDVVITISILPYETSEVDRDPNDA